jgi:hypothetical protein
VRSSRSYCNGILRSSKQGVPETDEISKWVEIAKFSTGKWLGGRLQHHLDREKQSCPQKPRNPCVRGVTTSVRRRAQRMHQAHRASEPNRWHGRFGWLVGWLVISYTRYGASRAHAGENLRCRSLIYSKIYLPLPRPIFYKALIKPIRNPFYERKT